MKESAGCPFCGSGEVRLNEILKSRRYVHCEGCGADGPPGRSVEEAWERWERRVGRVARPNPPDCACGTVTPL